LFFASIAWAQPRAVTLFNGKDLSGWTVLPGRIGLQSDGGEIHFRRVELRPIVR
jgi:hypothetical protein